jgi:hypothetical protein
MPRGAVIVSLSGGVGNQLFQYAAGRTVANERGVPLQVVRAGKVASRSLGVPDLIDVPAVSLHPRERFVGNLPGAPLRSLPEPLRRAGQGVGRRALRWVEVRQGLMQMADPAPAGGLTDVDARYVHLRGLFQHPSWYEPVLGAMTNEMANNLHDRIDLSAGEGRVAMHFRRGDYVLYGYDLPLSFQEEALGAIAACHTVGAVDIMSDDRQFALLAADHFRARGFDARAVTRESDDSELDDFCLLASAQHVVMSNSTFVWWAAVLGDRLRPADRMVVCPTPWMPASAAKTIPSLTLDLSRAHWSLRPVLTQ